MLTAATKKLSIFRRWDWRRLSRFNHRWIGSTSGCWKAKGWKMPMFFGCERLMFFWLSRWWFQFQIFFSLNLGKIPNLTHIRRSGSKPLASGSAGPPGGCYSSRELGDPSKKHQALAGAALLWSSFSCETFVPWYFLHCLELGRDQLRNQTAH